MNCVKVLSAVLLPVLFFSCSVSKSYSPDRKYSPKQLQQDYSLLRNIFETEHPSLYWYTPKDSMDQVFDAGYSRIKDSMTELQFGWKVLAPLLTNIHCGHTSFLMSKHWNKFIRDKRIPSFPLFMKIWNDTMVVTINLNRKDSILKRGTMITGINGIPTHELLQKMFSYLVTDGYAENINYIRLSANFPYFHRNIFGLYKTYTINYLDSDGIERKAIVPLYNPGVDSSITRTGRMVSMDRIKRKDRLEETRTLEFDSMHSMAVMTLNSFTGGGLRTFFRRSFRTIKQKHYQNLVLDIRNNGGGKINNSVLLTKYLRNTSFKVADTATAITRNLGKYTRYTEAGILNNIGLFILTSKHRDGLYHFRFWESHYLKPKQENHFKGKVYVLINGPTFSASTLFCNAVKGQENIKLVGEETGGGWYGNNGIMIPDVTLPHTRLRVRLPLFRLVQYNHIDIKGTGVPPDIYVGSTIDAVTKGIDRKIEAVKTIIESKR